MHLMTLSQVLHFKHNCGELESVATELKSKGFLSHMEFFMLPFQIQLDEKELTIDFTFEYAGKVHDDTMMENLLPKMCADYRIYNCIMFHLISNAIKHCPMKSRIRVELSFWERLEADSVLTGELSTKITNEGSFDELL